MKEKIIEGLKSLDPKTDAQWTQEGLVNLNAFKFVLGGEAVTREQLEEVAPGFNRENAEVYFVENATVKTDYSLQTADNVVTGFNADSSADVVVVDSNLSAIVFRPTDVGEGVSNLSDEALAQAEKGLEARRNDLLGLKQNVEKFLNSEFQLLMQIEAEIELRKPKLSQAEMVRLMHEAAAQSGSPIIQGRQRVAPVQPLLKK